MNKKENRGGKREGAGAKPKKAIQYSEEHKKKLLRAFNKKAKITGKTIYELQADMAYDPTVQDAVRLGAIKQFNDAMVVKELNVKTDNLQVIVLPPVMEEPEQ